MASKVVIPEVEVYARPFGYLQWVCPNCHEIHGAEQISGRSGRIGCGNCKRTFRVGFRFTAESSGLPPFNANYNPDWNGCTVNRTVWSTDPYAAVGRFRGRMDWSCIVCHGSNSAIVGDVLMDVCCVHCDAKYFLGVIFHAGKPGVHVKCPLDWSLPYEAPRDIINTVALAPSGKE